MIWTILWLTLNITLIIILKSWYDRNRIAQGKHIYHGWEIAVAIAWGLFFTWLIGASSGVDTWRTMPLQTALFWIAFDLSINLGRGKPWLYVGSSWNDLLAKKLFGQDAEVVMALVKIAFLIASIVLVTIKHSALR